MGDKSKYTTERGEMICELLSKGTPLAEICRIDPSLNVRTVNHWTTTHPEFLAMFARARAEGYDAIAAETLRIADDGENDYMQSIDSEGAVAYKLNGEHVQRSKLRIETRLKLLAKWDPKRYGDRVTTDHTSSDGTMTPPTRIELVAKGYDNSKD